MGPFQFEDPLLPPVVRDPSSLSFADSTANSLSLYGHSDLLKGNSKIVDDYDWSDLIRPNVDNEATPEYNHSPPSNNSSPPDKDEAPPTPMVPGLDMEPPSAFVRKTEFGSDADLPSGRQKGSDLDQIFSEAFDWDRPLLEGSWLISPAQ